MANCINLTIPCHKAVAVSYQPLSVQQSLTGVSSNVSVPNEIESANYFSLKNSTTKFLPDVSESSGKPQWIVTVWIEASAQHLAEVDHVIYHTIVVPSGERRDLSPVSSIENNFSQSIIIVGGFPLTATLYFKDGGHVDLGPLNIKAIIPREYVHLSLIHLNLNPFMIGLNVTINGEAKSSIANITRIHVDWGDNKTSDGKEFPFSHKYSTAGPYTITVTAYSTLNISASQRLQTDLLSLERIIPLGASISVAKGQYLLTVLTSSSGVPDNSAMPYTVWGSLSYVNGSGIRNENINLRITSIERPNIYNDTIQEQTNSKGYYNHTYDRLNFEPGQYRISVNVPSSNYAGLNVNKDLFVLAHPLSTDELITYLATAIGIILAVIGVIVKVPSYFTNTKQANYLSIYIEQIYKLYNEFKKDEKRVLNRQKYQDKLEDIRNTIIYLLQRRDISESHFKMLDDKISDYQQEIGSTK